MKILLASIFLVALGLSYSSAALITQTDIQSVDTQNGATFTFNKFNPSLGSLTAIDLVINSSTPAGSTSVTNNHSSSNVTIRYIRSSFEMIDDVSLGYAGYQGSNVNLYTNPLARLPTNFVLAPLSSQVFTVNPSQSLIGGSAITESISSSSFNSYLGAGTVSFNAVAQVTLNTLGSSYSVDSSLYDPVTSVSLNYTYTPTAPVPEASQVAASLLGLSFAVIYLVNRRRSAIH